jgi:formylglycine-generating enzyme required for sulfatase activity
MGCSPGDKQCDTDETPHTVKLAKGFWMGETGVTQAAYKKVTRGSNPSHFQGVDFAR